MATRKATAKRSPKKSIDLHSLGARVVSVYGPFNSRVLIEVPADTAAEMFPESLAASGLTNVVDGAEREIAALHDRDPALAESALAASAVALAREIEHPYNSATSKSMCAREMRDTLDRLRELAPEEQHADQVDDLAERRAQRLATAG